MFEFLYMGQIIETCNKHPREAAACIAAIVIIPGIHIRHTQVKLAKIRSNNDVEIARLEKETAELKFKTAQMFNVEPASD